MRYTLVGGARIVNLMLAAALATSAIGNLFLFRDSIGLAAVLSILSAALLVGVLSCSPLAYIGIATLSFMGAATALSSTDLLFVILNLAAMAAALFVRARLLVRAPGPVGSN